MDNIKNIKDIKMKAAAVYYTLLNLHMFSDGNGRTSRFMYDWISGDLNEDNLAYYFHKDSNNTIEQKNEFEKEKGIWDISIVNQIPDEVLNEKPDFIPQEIMKSYHWITVGHTNTSPATDKIIPPAVLSELSKKEVQDLDIILRDGYGVNFCPSGIAMLYVIQKKNQLNEWLKYNENDFAQGIGIPGRFNISIYKHPERIAHWSLEDFREVINIGNAFKYTRLKMLIDIFAFKEEYINRDSGNAYADDILNISKTKDSEEIKR